MEYAVHMNPSGSLERGQHRGVFQLTKGDVVIFSIPCSIDRVTVDLHDFTCPEDPVDPYWKFRFVFSSCGSIAVVAGSQRTHIVVSPISEKLTIQTFLPRRLGTVDTWLCNLSPAFDAFHLPPVQRPGESQSCYSIADHRDIDPALLPARCRSMTVEERRETFYGYVAEITRKKILVTDVVLNHVASSSALLDEHPSVGYTEITAPHLKAAFELERDLIELESCGLVITNEAELIDVMNTVRVKVVEPFKMEEFFLINFEKSIDLFRASRSTRVDSPILNADERPLLDQALVQTGMSRAGFVVDGRRLYETVEEFEAALYATQARLNTEADYTKHEIVSSLTGYFRYHCLTLREYQVHFPRYFTTRNDDRYFANNGWVIGWPAEKDFAAPGCFVYLRRQLVCWGDCVKLYFGSSEEANPFLWRYMTEYSVDQARHFRGIRLDNAHSTSPAFLAHVIREMRNANRDLFVMAELFSGDERADELFVERLGINALVREIIQVNSVHDVVFNLWRLGCRDAASLSLPKVDGIPRPTLVPTRPRAIFYDCTHDNPTPKEKFGQPTDALGLAAVAAAAPCVAGSVRGFDDLLSANTHVVPDGKFYLSESRIPDEDMFVWPGDMDAKTVVVFGAWDSWIAPIALTKELKRCSWTAMRPPATRGCEFKYVIDGFWRINPMEPAVVSGHSINNVSVDPLNPKLLTFKDVRNKLSEISNRAGFSECYFEALPRHGCVYIKRVNPETHASIVTVIRFAFAPVETTDLIEINLEGELDEILLDCSLRVFESEPSVAGGHADSLLQGLAHAVVTNASLTVMQDQRHKVEIALPQSSSVLIFSTKPLDLAIPSVPDVSQLSLSQINTVLFQCDAEERARTCGSQGAYHVPEYGHLVYAGLQGVVSVLDRIREEPGHLGHPLCENIREGDWLVEYHIRRLQGSPEFATIASWLEYILDNLVKRAPRHLKPVLVDNVLTAIYSELVSRAKSMFSCSDGQDLLENLYLASIQFVDERTLMSAGLPHFSAGYMRSWGRDTFISFRGLLLIPKRFDEAKDILRQFACIEKFGLIPNLSDAPSFSNPRYNCRDAAWWFAKAWVDFEKISGQSLPDVEAVVIRIIEKHWKGIRFREPRAGKEIDAHMRDRGFEVEVFVDKKSGLIYGGNSWNCGTWMDKMGSSVWSGNDGVPASSRDGAAVEINAVALYVLEAISPKGGIFLKWRDLLAKNFDESFWSEENGFYRDVLGSQRKEQENKLRPNAGLSLAFLPQAYIDVSRAKQHLRKSLAFLMEGPLGCKTLSKDDPDYRGFYDNGDSSDFATACGFNYHNGPEWLWPVGLIYSACMRFGVLSKKDVMGRLQSHSLHISRDDWKSLPELTNASGAKCPGSCAAQAWSVATLIELLIL